MQSENRDLESFGKGLTDEQIIEKKKMLKESAETHPEIAEYFRDLAVDFWCGGEVVSWWDGEGNWLA